MPKRFPCEFFIKALLLRHTVPAVIAQLPSLGYQGVTATYLTRIRGELQRTRPMPDLEGPAMEIWLREERILTYHTRDPMALQAREWLDDVRVRPTLEMLLLGGLQPDYISEQIELLAGLKLPIKAIELYAHYFWNRELLDRADWKDILTTTSDAGYPVDKYPNGRELLTAYLADPQVALWRVGILSSLDPKTILETVLGDTVMRWLELKIEPNTVNLARKMEHFWGIIKGAFEEQRVAGHALTRVFEGLHTMSLELQKMPMRDARELLDRSKNVEEVRQNLAKRMIGPAREDVV